MAAENFLATADRRWNIVVRREVDIEDIFYYGVRTTGIYCRPGCASRLPNRGNVEFFDSCGAAERAGYRPCRRCQPGTLSRHEKIEGIMVQACHLIEQAGAPLRLAELAAESGMSPGHFHRLFKKIVGVTPKRYVALMQSQKFRRCLKSGQSVTEAIYEAGYGSSSRAYEKSQDRLAMTPKTFRSGGEGLRIGYGISSCSLGVILVAATERGICAIEFGDDPVQAAEELQKNFPKAALHRAGPEFSALVEQVVTLVEAPEKGCNLPLDIRGTAFQERVWAALRGIEPGTTASYGEIAARIGRPAAARAVARACATNRLAVAVPCHRVVRRDGKRGGYRWGEARKRLLLDREQQGGQDAGTVAAESAGQSATRHRTSHR